MKPKTLKKINFATLINSFRTTAIVSLVLLVIFFAISSVVYGLPFTSVQFLTYWYFMIILAFSFGFQIAREIQLR